MPSASLGGQGVLPELVGHPRGRGVAGARVVRPRNGRDGGLRPRRQVLEAIPRTERLVALFGDARDDANGKTTSASVCDAAERWRPGEVVDLGHALDHAVAGGDTLYAQPDWTLRTYDLTRGWEVQASAEIGHIDSRFSYISGMVSAKG